MKRAFESDIAARFFNVDELRALLDAHRAGTRDNSRRIWILYSFLVWYRVFFIGKTKPSARGLPC